MMMRKIGAWIGLTVVMGMCFVYFAQNGQLEPAQQKHEALIKEIAVLEKQLQLAKAASVIKTDNWAQYCDELNGFCFRYPSSWNIDESTDEQFGYASATVTDPTGLVSVRYANPLIKDGGPGSAHLVVVDTFMVAGKKLKVIGGYPVASGDFNPMYEVVDVPILPEAAPGKLSAYIINAVFDVGDSKSVALSATANHRLPASEQAKAWFQSTEGKTVLAIVKSLSVKE